MAPANTALLGRTLAAFAVGLPFFSAFQFLTRTFYATQDAKTPALANIAVAIVNLGVDLWLAFGLGLGVPGLALGYAISYLAGHGRSCMSLVRKRLEGADGRRIARNDRANAGRIGPHRGGRVGAAAGVAAVLDVSRPLMRLRPGGRRRCGRCACLRAGRPYLQDPGGR